MTVEVVENVLKLNDEIAGLNREVLQRHGIFSVDLMGAPGCGKTALLEETIRRMRDRRIAIICGDPATRRDAERIAALDARVVQVNTGRGCHLEANHVHEALRHVDLNSIDALFIENVGNLICPVGFDLGQDAKIGMFSVCGGDDKAAKHPAITCEAALLVLSKTDLLPHVAFNLEEFRTDVAKLNPRATMLELSVASGAGVDLWIGWLEASIASRS
jgi:hydrogenase nickel incorporation protein HypB